MSSELEYRATARTLGPLPNLTQLTHAPQGAYLTRLGLSPVHVTPNQGSSHGSLVVAQPVLLLQLSPPVASNRSSSAARSPAATGGTVSAFTLTPPSTCTSATANAHDASPRMGGRRVIVCFYINTRMHEQILNSTVSHRKGARQSANGHEETHTGRSCQWHWHVAPPLSGTAKQHHGCSNSTIAQQYGTSIKSYVFQERQRGHATGAADNRAQRTRVGLPSRVCKSSRWDLPFCSTRVMSSCALVVDYSADGVIRGTRMTPLASTSHSTQNVASQYGSGVVRTTTIRPHPAPTHLVPYP